jgi:alpha-L-fucosidase
MRLAPSQPPCRLLRALAIFLVLFASGGCFSTSGDNEEKEAAVKKEPAIPAAVPEPSPCGAVPAPYQLLWHDTEYYALIHFGTNTFTDREWGHGDEEPELFNPSELDCRQWARVCREAGMKGMVITAKHHDGFCLWPTETTDHCVRSCSWRKGKGDVVGELATACREEGLKFGVYLSPWDRNQPCYGDSPRYNEFYLKQAGELLTRYGDLFMFWVDGACGEGKNGKRQVYDWEKYFGLVRELQPGAAIFSDAGPGVRWIGNEAGRANPTNWCTLDRAGRRPGDATAMKTNPSGNENGSDWVPSECDTPLRPGWFYHPRDDDRVKPLHQLLDIYYTSIGSNSSLNLGLAPDRRGLIHENDATRLRELRRIVDLTFADDLAAGGRAMASNTRGQTTGMRLAGADAPSKPARADAAYSPANVIDGDPDTYWACDDGVRSARLEVVLDGPKTFNNVMLGEKIRLGQRVKAYVVDIRENGVWRELTRGTTIGRKRILRTGTVTADRVRLHITDSKACPTLTTLALFAAPPRVFFPLRGATFFDRLLVPIETDYAATEIYFTLDGSRPSRATSPYTGPIELTGTARLRAVAFAGGSESWNEADRTFEELGSERLEPAVRPFRTLEPGLAFSYYEGGWQSLHDLPSATRAATGRTAGFDLDVRQRDEHFALRFEGFVEIPKDGVYVFYTASDDGSRLFIGGREIVSNNYLQGLTERDGHIALARGLHPITVEYFNATGGMGLSVSWEGPSFGKETVPADRLFSPAVLEGEKEK